MNKIIKHGYEIASKKIKKVRIVLLSDIHYYDQKDCLKLNSILDYIKELKLDYIAIAGDLLDEAFPKDLDYLYDWFVRLSNCATIIVSLGNHDLLIEENFKAGFNKDFFEKLNSIPRVRVLDNTSFIDNNICFMGLTMPASYYYEEYEPKNPLIEKINSVFPKTNNNNFNILLCHSPLMITQQDVLEKIDIRDNLDLVVCGHTHGGITPEFLKPILKGIGFISPLRKLFFKNAYGYVKINNTNFVISSGITKASHRNRFHKLDPLFAREITIIDLKKQKP